MCLPTFVCDKLLNVCGDISYYGTLVESYHMYLPSEIICTIIHYHLSFAVCNKFFLTNKMSKVNEVCGNKNEW